MLKLSGLSVYSSVSSPLKYASRCRFKYGGFAVEEADGFALFGDGVGDDAAVERCGQCLGKFVHGVDKEMIWHDFTRFAAFPHGCVQGRFDGTMSVSAVRFEHDGF